MKEKYLPLGTVCTIKGNTNKIMIVGFLSLDYNGNLNVYDYKGCIYPKGLFSSSGTISFNHNDIEKIDFMGYESDLHKSLNDSLLSVSVVDTVKEQTKNVNPSRYVFDANGVIIMDNAMQEVASKPVEEKIENPFKMNYQSQNIAQNQNKFKFDDNGVIISDGTEAPQEQKGAKYQFDANGFIISDGTNEFTPQQVESKYKFDENGVIIDDGSKQETSKPVESKYKFDENGVIIAE